jgi:Ca-activated chloride channel family protein
MTERDLENLKELAAPPARTEARCAAIDAALAAFDAAADANSQFEHAAQGNAAPVRPIRTMNRTRSFLMGLTSRQNMAIAASLAALVIVAPIAFKTYQTERTISLPMQPAKPETVAVVPPKLGEERLLKEKATEPPAPTVKLDSKDLSGKAETETQPSTLGVSGEYDAAGSAANSTSLAPNGAIGSGAVLPAPAPPPPFLAAPSPAAIGVPGYAIGFDGGGPAQDALANMPARQMQFGDASDATRSYLAAGDESRPEAPSARPGEEGRDVFNAPEVNPVKQVTSEPVSTFSIDVDTASYSFMRRALNAGRLPPKESVRVEELINYFPYSYPAPETADVPFKPTVTVMPSPWKPTNKLVHIAIKGYDLKRTEQPRANLVFLLDISGSMEPEDRLPLVKNALRLLVDQLHPDDTVGIVTYASGSGIALEPTKIADKQKILAAIDKLEAGGSTDGADGIEDAYRLAEAGFDKSAVNRIILATDGDFNVGITDRDQLKSYIERKRKSGVFLSILGVGEGNHNDALMQALAQNGNGTAAYVDTLSEARKVLVDEASSTLFTIAKDVKVQIEWNPARVAEYRLIGYETRALKREDFNNDQVDAGDIGSGHTVTAIYEVTPVGAPRLVDDLRYAKAATESGAASHPAAGASDATELGFLKLRYKKPNEDASQLISLPISDGLAKPALSDVPQDVRFSVAVAAFGDLVRGAPFVNGFTYDDVLSLAQSARGDDPFGYRAEFLNLARLAKSARP